MYIYIYTHSIYIYMLPMTDPWDDCIFTYTFSLNGKFRYRYNRPMDLVGYEKQPYCWVKFHSTLQKTKKRHEDVVKPPNL